MPYSFAMIRTYSLVLMLLLATGQIAQGDTLVFGFANNSLNGLPSKLVPFDTFNMQLAAGGPATARLWESNGSPGLGIDSTGSSSSEGEQTLFDNFTGTSELVTFSFDKAGVLTGLDFDGVKDELYEYMMLRTATSPDLFFFDSFETSSADPGLISVPGQVVFLEEFHGPDDSALDLHIPFAAGQEFTITYGDLPVGGVGNGARLQRVVVQGIPEPATWIAAGVAILCQCSARGRIDRFSSCV